MLQRCGYVELDIIAVTLLVFNDNLARKHKTCTGFVLLTYDVILPS